MATARQQADFRANDSKHLVQVRLDPATVEKLDEMVRERGATGRAAVVEALLAGEHAASEPQPQRVWLGWP